MKATLPSGGSRPAPSDMTEAPADALGARLFQLSEASLRITCGCSAEPCFWPVDAIGKAYGDGYTIRDVLRRLRCTVCGSRQPAGVELVEWIETGEGGPDTGWSVELVPALWPEPEAAVIEDEAAKPESAARSAAEDGKAVALHGLAAFIGWAGLSTGQCFRISGEGFKAVVMATGEGER